LLVFWLVWWAWTQFTWALNAANTEHPRVQLATLLATALAFLLAIGIPRAIGGTALWFAAPYVAVRGVGLLVYYWVARTNVRQRRAVGVFGLVSLSGLVAVLIGAGTGGSLQFAFWGLAILLDLLAAGVGAQLDGWDIHPEHFAERHGLIVIIALGETLIVAASGLVAAPPTPLAMVTGLLAVAVSCALWWSYFCQARSALEHGLAARQGNARSRLARDAFSVLHFPMLCGIIAMAAATEVALAHPEVPLDAATRVALGGGAVLFVGGTAAALRRTAGKWLRLRVTLVVAGAVGVVAAGAIPVIGLAILLASLVAVAIGEQRQQTRHREPAPSRS
jgi:low temperature requirement protein LtrA